MTTTLNAPRYIVADLNGTNVVSFFEAYKAHELARRLNAKKAAEARTHAVRLLSARYSVIDRENES